MAAPSLALDRLMWRKSGTAIPVSQLSVHEKCRTLLMSCDSVAQGDMQSAVSQSVTG